VFERNGNRTPTAVHAQRASETARSVAEHASALTRLELELVQIELKRKLTALGLGIGLSAAAAVLALSGLGFLVAAATAAIALTVPWWAALLAVAVGLLLLGGVLGLLGLTALRKGSPPVPERAIEEAKQTTLAIRS
jgi:hypothetical protein